MSTSRRAFLKKGTLVALAAGIPLGLTEKLALGTVAPSPAGLNRLGFEAQLNTDFFINTGLSKLRVRLVDVAALAGEKTSPARREAFSLLFRGDRSTALRQKTYTIEHAKLGVFSYFIVPIGTMDQNARYYEAVINRVHP